MEEAPKEDAIEQERVARERLVAVFNSVAAILDPLSKESQLRVMASVALMLGLYDEARRMVDALERCR